MSLVRSAFYWQDASGLTRTFTTAARPVPRRLARATVRARRGQAAPDRRVRQQVASIPVAVGPRVGLRLQPPRRLALVVAAAPARDPQDALDVRQLGDAALVRRRGHQLRAGPVQGQRQVRHVAARHPRPVRHQALRDDEGDARRDPQGAPRPRAPLDRGLVDRGDRHLHHVRPGPQAQGQEVDARDRDLWQRPADAPAPAVPVPARLALRRPDRGRVECFQRDPRPQERLDPGAARYVALPASLSVSRAVEADPLRDCTQPVCSSRSSPRTKSSRTGSRRSSSSGRRTSRSRARSRRTRR